MDKEIQQQALLMIKELAEKLGTTAEHLWAVLVRQAVVEATTNLITFGVVAGALILASAVAWFYRGENLKPFSIIVWILLLIIGAAVCANNVPQLLNPEYWAFKQLKP